MLLQKNMASYFHIISPERNGVGLSFCHVSGGCNDIQSIVHITRMSASSESCV